MTNLNVRFFSHFILWTYLVDIKLITSQFLPIFTLINIRTRVPFKITSTPNNQYITKLPNLQKRVFPQKNKKTSPTRQYTYPHTIPTFHTEKGDHSACTTQENFTVDIVATKKPPMKKIHRKLPIILLYNVYTNQILASVVTIKSHVRATDGMLTRSSGECGCCKSGPIEIMSISG